MDGHIPPMPTAQHDPLRQAEAQITLLTDQMADARQTLDFFAELPPPSGAQTWKQQCEMMQLWARRCIARLEGN